MFLVLFAALLIRADVSANDNYNAELFGAIIAVVVVSPVFLCVVMRACVSLLCCCKCLRGLLLEMPTWMETSPGPSPSMLVNFDGSGPLPPTQQH